MFFFLCLNEEKNKSGVLEERSSFLRQIMKLQVIQL